MAVLAVAQEINSLQRELQFFGKWLSGLKKLAAKVIGDQAVIFRGVREGSRHQLPTERKTRLSRRAKLIEQRRILAGVGEYIDPSVIFGGRAD